MSLKKATSHVPAALALLLTATAAPAQTISNYAWVNSTGTFSSYHFRNGTGVGSRYLLMNGTGPGSLHYYFNGTGFGSAYFYRNGTAAGSRYFWRNGTGAGSAYHWRNGTACLSDYFWRNAADNEQSRRQCPSGGSAIVFVTAMCLAGQFDLPPCGPILEAVGQQRGAMERIRELRASFGN